MGPTPMATAYYSGIIQMDVFIPEEYVIRRRIEKRAAAIAGKRPNKVPEATKRTDKEKKSLPPPFRLDSNDFLVSGGIGENLDFGCFSA
ncbi:hypothetical protein QUC31_008891 [Theobroma cacao]|uniref:Uncharacterized protein LOC18606492 n=2 Tax=Theobroma cacao TaxID=3641 RepID=A0AB32VF82_THECC|nr:PREDICTED: uncharacterized protein LOC18606492 [Theobroma cacao]EOY24681.1 Nucleotide binding, putative [Theobroma cacao]